jgi:hypothetical protein
MVPMMLTDEYVRFLKADRDDSYHTQQALYQGSGVILHAPPHLQRAL